MNPIQESKQELEASIRYAENAIASAKQTIESIAKSQEQTGREQALESEVVELRNIIDRMGDDITGDSVTIKQLQDEVQLQKDIGQGYYDSMMTFKSQVALLEERIRNDVPTMPVIPKDVAIAIFREGLAHGAEAVATEIDNACDICIEESDYVGNFEVSFTKDIDLSDHLDTDWLRGRADEIGETFVLDCLANLCADNKFECRIHGVDDQEEKKND